MELKELLHTDLAAVCVGSSDSLQAAAERITDAQCGCIFVLDQQGCLVGVLTDGDVRRALAQFEPTPGIALVTVAQAATAHPVYAYEEETSLVDAYHRMQRCGINTLPIVGAHRKYLGYVEFHEVAGALSPERLYPDSTLDGSENVQRHVARYRFAAQFIERGAVVLDCACGSGYGSGILAGRAARVIGVDKSEEAIDYAKAHHSSPKIVYEHMYLETLAYQLLKDVRADGLDAVVTLETLEHVPEDVCRTFLYDVGRWIKPGGVLVASSPMLRYRDGKPFVTSPYHVNELPTVLLVQMFYDCLPGYTIHHYHQRQDTFLPLLDEDTGFLVVVARRKG